MNVVSAHRRTSLVVLLLVTATLCAAGCKSTPNGPQLSRAESLYKSLGGPSFVGPDGGISTRPVFDWFDAHTQFIDKFNGKDGVCNGYEPSGEMAQRERTVCAGAAHASLALEFKRERNQ